MKNYGLAALTLGIGLALGVIIGLLVNRTDGEAGDRLAGVEAQLQAASADLAAADDEVASLRELLDQSERGRRSTETELERVLDGLDSAEGELRRQLEVAQAEIRRLDEESQRVAGRSTEAAAAVTAHVFMLQELFGYAQAGFAGESFATDPAIVDAYRELPPEISVVIQQLFAEPDATTAGVQYWVVLQQVVNSLQETVLD